MTLEELIESTYKADPDAEPIDLDVYRAEVAQARAEAEPEAHARLHAFARSLERQRFIDLTGIVPPAEPDGTEAADLSPARDGGATDTKNAPARTGAQIDQDTPLTAADLVQLW